MKKYRIVESDGACFHYLAECAEQAVGMWMMSTWFEEITQGYVAGIAENGDIVITSAIGDKFIGFNIQEVK